MTSPPTIEPLLDDPYEADWPEPRIRFSAQEIWHLLLSVAALSVAFSFALTSTSLFFGGLDQRNLDELIRVLPYAVAIVVPAFVLHELAHKVAAQRRHMEAEYRADFTPLAIGLAISLGTGYVFAAPGAVTIFANAVSRRDEGVISLVGPLVNLSIGFAAIALYQWAPGLDTSVGDKSFFQTVALVNGVLATFNMLPIRPLDGSKVWRWSRVAYLVTLAVSIGLIVDTSLGIGL